MAWTLIMLTIAFGLMVSAFIGWRQERRDEQAHASEQIPAATSDGDGADFRMTTRTRPTGARSVYATAKP